MKAVKLTTNNYIIVDAMKLCMEEIIHRAEKILVECKGLEQDLQGLSIELGIGLP